MRCLTLADALRERGAETLFVSASLPAALRERIVVSGHEIADTGPAPWLGRLVGDWEAVGLTVSERAADYETTLAAIGSGADWLVVDHYLLDREWESAARAVVARICAIDDLANRPHDCDLLIDQTLGRSDADYRLLVPDGAALLCGPRFSLLRPEFARERPAALERRRRAGPVRRIMVSLGGMDIGGFTASAVRAALDAAPGRAIDVVIGNSAPALVEARGIAAANPSVELHVDTTHMAGLMSDADLAIGAAGTSSWERCCLGLPAVVFAVAGNQRPSAQALEDADAILCIDSVAQLAEALMRLLVDPDRLARMTAAAFAIVDGLGTQRVVGQMIRAETSSEPERIELRRAHAADCERLWLWRNDPETRRYSRNRNAIAWNENEQWFSDALARSDRRLFVAEQGKQLIGMARFDRTEGKPASFEVSINLAPEARGRGVGRALLRQACDKWAAEAGAATIYASIHESNVASRRIFETCGFVRQGDGEGGFGRYALQLDASRLGS